MNFPLNEGAAAPVSVVIDGVEGFRQLLGRTLGPSRAMEITQERIETFCRAVDNFEWTHWDEARCQQSRFGTTIAPAAFIQAIFPYQWHSLAELRGFKSAVIAGSDRFRLLTPLRKGSVLHLLATVAAIEDRGKDAAVFLDLQWEIPGGGPAAVARYVLRLTTAGISAD